MIDPNKTYRTRDGRAVRIYATDAAFDFPIHGAVSDGSGWEVMSWTRMGLAPSARNCDLVEVTLADELTKQIPWEALRPEIQWVAMDYNKVWYAYTHQPEKFQESRCWSTPINTASWLLEMLSMPKVESNRWHETLCKRPEVW